MIVPQNKLLFWFAAVVLPFALIGAVVPVALVVAVVFIGGLIVLALADAVMARASLKGIAVEFRGVIRMSKDREGKLELRIRNEPQKEKRLRLALDLPRELESPQEDVTVELAVASEWSRLALPCLPRKRGSFALDAAYVESASPLGFWAARKKLPVHAC